MSVGGGRFRDPEAVLLEEDVGQDDELPHDGRDGDLGGLAGVAQCGVLPPEVGVAADDRHVLSPSRNPNARPHRK